MNYENELEIDLGRCFHALLKKWHFMLIMAIIFCVAGVVLTLEPKDDMFTATSTVYSMSTESYSYTQQGVSAMNDYVDIASSMKVCERAALLMGNGKISGEDVMDATTVSTGKKSTSSTTVVDSTIISITSEINDPVMAMEMAKAVAEAFVMEMENILGNDSVRILDEPYAYKQTYNGVQMQWLIRIALFMIGAVIAAGIIVVMEVFDNKTSTIRECTMREQLPVIGVIPRFKD